MEDNNINNTDKSVNVNVNPIEMGGVNNKKVFNMPLKLVIISFMIIIIAIIAVVLILNKDKEKPKVEIDKVEEDVIDKINGSEVDTFYEEKVDETLGEFNVEDENTFTEEEVTKLLTERGLYGETTSKGVIISYFKMDGNTTFESEISSTSKERHPSYLFLYSGEPETSKWEISVVGKEIIAYPMAYDMIHMTTGKIRNVILEKNTLVSYDEKVNKFSRKMPTENEFIVTNVEKIDAQTLDELSNTKFYFEI